jgi:hypothetical protein
VLHYPCSLGFPRGRDFKKMQKFYNSSTKNGKALVKG